MAITVTEKLESRRLTTGKNATLELSLNVVGTDSETDAKIAATNATPEAWGSLSNPPLLFRQSIQLEVVGPKLWIATVRYDTTGTQPISAEDSLEFDTSGGTQHVTQSLDTVGIFAPRVGSPRIFKAQLVLRRAVSKVSTSSFLFSISVRQTDSLKSVLRTKAQSSRRRARSTAALFADSTPAKFYSLAPLEVAAIVSQRRHGS